MRKKVLTGTSSFADFDKAPLNKLIEADFHVVQNPYKRKLTKAELLELLGDVSGIIAGLEPLDREVLRSSKLKVISRVGAGLSNVDLQASEELGIRVYSTPDAPTNAVAELTVAGMLNCLRQIPQMNQDLHNKLWIRQNGLQLEGKKVLIIGYGRIGRRVAELLRPFNVELIVVDPFVKEKGLNVLSIEDALPQADIITFHCSGEGRILTRERFKLVKKGAIICNAARGGLIDEDELIEALNNGQVSGCWLDTFEEEPYTGRLTKFSQVILTPHVGSYTRDCRVKMEMQAVDNLITGFREAKK